MPDFCAPAKLGWLDGVAHCLRMERAAQAGRRIVPRSSLLAKLTVPVMLPAAYPSGWYFQLEKFIARPLVAGLNTPRMKYAPERELGTANCRSAPTF